MDVEPRDERDIADDGLWVVRAAKLSEEPPICSPPGGKQIMLIAVLEKGA